MSSSVCRVCLIGNIKMFEIQDKFQETYETLSKTPTMNMKQEPARICYICLHRLKMCHRFSEMAQTSENILVELFHKGIEATNLTIGQDLQRQHNLSISPVKYSNTSNLEYIDTFETVTPIVVKLDVTSNNNLPIDPETSEIESRGIAKENCNGSVFENSSGTDIDFAAKDYVCNMCGKKYVLRKSFVRHIKSHSDQNLHMCSLNSKLDRDSSDTHMGVHVDNPHACSKHDKGFCEQIQSKIKPFTCKCCVKKFSCNSSLVTHMRIHTGEKPFSCELCDKRFALHGNLTAHARTHTGKKRFTCEKCAKTFYSHSHLVRHTRSHTKEKNYACDHCEKTFYSSSDRVKHTRIHTGEKPFKCEHCMKEFTEQSNMIKHVRLHTGEKLFTCEKCGKRFSQRSNLITHMQIHSGEKSHICKQCDKKFACKASLTKHTRVHTGEKPYICNVCGKCFTQKCHLILHVRVHSREKPRSNLITHMQIHSGEKSHKCKQCNITFSCKFTLIKHMHAHARGKVLSYA